MSEEKKIGISNSDRAHVLVQAMPYIKRWAGETIVVKYGGNAMINPELKEAVMNDIVLMQLVGVNVVLVHGGGPEISAMLKKLGKESRFVDGLRCTDAETMDVVQQVLCGKVNKHLVSIINNLGGKAIGLCGLDGALFQAKKLDEKYGLVGKIVKVAPQVVNDALSCGYIPVISTVALGIDNDTAYNINADTVAGEVAAAVGAQKIVFITDVDGIYKDFDDKTTLISRMALSEAAALADEGTMSSGMIPKINACVTALSAGVRKAHIINGTVAHSLVLEIFTDSGVGTLIMRHQNDSMDPDFVEAPVSNFASKLDQSIQTIGRSE